MSLLANTLCVGNLIIHHAFRQQICGCRRKHIHLADNGIAEPLAYKRLDVGIAGRMEGKTALWNEFCADNRMPIYAQSGIYCQPGADVLTEINVCAHLVAMLLLYQVAISILYQISLSLGNFILVPCTTSEVLPVESDGNGISLEEAGTLIPSDAGNVIVVQVKV